MNYEHDYYKSKLFKLLHVPIITSFVFPVVCINYLETTDGTWKTTKLKDKYILYGNRQIQAKTFYYI